MISPTILFILLSLALVLAEEYRLESIDGLPFIGIRDGEGHRHMATSTGNVPGLNGNPNTCSFIGDRFECNLGTTISNTANVSSNIYFTVNCLNEKGDTTQVDYRRARDCTCNAQVVNTATNVTKQCTCNVCPMNFGAQSSFSISCENNTADPFVIGNCGYFDCTFSCNGTCPYDCQGEIASQCPFCATQAPTSANIPKTQGSGASILMASSVVGALAFASLLL